MPFPNDDLLDYMGYRNMVVEDEIEQCLSAVHAGEDSIFIDSGDFTDEELLHIQEELQRRLENQ